MGALFSLLDQYNTDFLVIGSSALVFVSVTFAFVWYYNKRRFQNLRHQIPASVIQSYLDSIIQNSTALKSSLFRGQGVEGAAEGIPAIVPLGQATPTLTGSGDISAELYNQKLAELAALRAQLGEKDKLIDDLENRLNDAVGEVKTAQEQLAKAQTEGGAPAPAPAAEAPAPATGDDSALRAQLDEVTRERDLLKERLQEYEIIEDDLANLKRLQQENEQLKKALAEQGGSVPAAAESATSAEAAPAAAPEPPAEASLEEMISQDIGEAPAPEPEAPAEEAAPAPAAEESAPAEEESSPEDLLSEFEKMLG